MVERPNVGVMLKFLVCRVVFGSNPSCTLKSRLAAV